MDTVFRPTTFGNGVSGTPTTPNDTTTPMYRQERSVLRKVGRHKNHHWTNNNDASDLCLGRTIRIGQAWKSTFLVVRRRRDHLLRDHRRAGQFRYPDPPGHRHVFAGLPRSGGLRHQAGQDIGLPIPGFTQARRACVHPRVGSGAGPQRFLHRQPDE